MKKKNHYILLAAAFVFLFSPHLATAQQSMESIYSSLSPETLQKIKSLPPSDLQTIQSYINKQNKTQRSLEELKGKLSVRTTSVLNAIPKKDKKIIAAQSKSESVPLSSSIQPSQKLLKIKNNENKNKSLSLIEKNFSNSILKDFKPVTIISRTENIKQFGYDIFDTYFSPSESFLPVHDNYILGPGDEIIIHMWGKVEETLALSINRDGKVILPKIGATTLSGIRYGNLRQVLIQELSKEFVNFDISVSMERLRSIRTFILGDVHYPGAYTVNGMTTVFKALFESGGPEKMGSLRHIKLLRNGKTVSTIDLYHYLLKGDNSQDPLLQDNDTIFVPPISSVVKITGTVKKPAIYELVHNKQKTSSVLDIIDLAGGVTATTYFKQIQILRIDEGNSSIIFDQSFSSKKEFKKLLAKTYVKDGDHIKVLPITNTIRNFVTLEGHVMRSGHYELKKNATLGALLNSARGTRPETYKKRGEIYRFTKSEMKEIIPFSLIGEEWKSIELKEWDTVKIYSKKDVNELNTVQIRGAVQKPGKYNLLENMSLSDLLFKGKILNNANLSSIELNRKHINNKSKLYQFDLVKNPESAVAFLLKKDDEVFIKFPTHSNASFSVTLRGEIRYPGVYNITKDEPLSSVISRAGGFTDLVYTKGLIFSRQSDSQLNYKSKVVFNEEKKLVYDQKLLSSLTDDDRDIGIRVMESRFKALDYLKAQLQTIENRVILKNTSKKNFSKLSKSLILKNNDSFYFPKTPSTIEIIGGVQNPSKILFKENKTLKYYVNIVGNYTEYANKKQIYIFRANGSVSKNLSQIERGDVIYIPETINIPLNWLTITNKFSSILETLSKTASAYFLIKAIIEQ